MDPQNLEAGQVIDGFVLEQALDPGGMASFWRVSRPGSKLPMVMKIPLLRRGEDPLTIVGFEAEGMILARLSGPHVPKFVAAGDFERPYIVMELVAGRSVRTFLDKTPLAPEQVMRQRDDPRSDIFALGVILYFLATGERPFGEPQRAGEWRRRLWRDPYPPRRLHDKVPPWVQEVILRCLAVDPAERYATAA